MDVIEALYKQQTSSDFKMRAHFSGQIERAQKYYSRYVDFVDKNAVQPKAKILDLGCGEGWGTLFLRQKGYDAIGLDLQPEPLEAQSLDRDLPYLRGDGKTLPLANDSVDMVAMHQVLAHFPNPDASLKECLRILRPGGRLIIVGPNLLCFLYNAYWSVKHTLRCLSQGKLWEKRVAGMPRHPGGNTMPESWKFTFIFFFKTMKKWLGESPVHFWMREPDTQPPFHANNDVCYYCNPMDIVNWARKQKGLQILRYGKDDGLKGRFTWFLGGGMWMVLEKAGNS